MTTKIIIDQNNQTLQLLQAQDFGKAIKSSLLAIRYCKQQLVVMDCIGETTISRRCLKECLDHSMLLHSPPSANHDDSSSDGSTYFVYQEGIPVPLDTTDLTMVSPILIFNAALAHQLLAEREQETRKNAASNNIKFLLKAKALYRLACSQVDVNVDTLFHFAVMNNIAVIDQKLGNVRVSMSCFRYLQARYLLLMHQGKSERLRHLEGFWGRNLLSARKATAKST